jgi:hypothetical protein
MILYEQIFLGVCGIFSGIVLTGTLGILLIIIDKKFLIYFNNIDWRFFKKWI